MKIYKKEQDDLQKMKDYVARFCHGSRKLAKQERGFYRLSQKRKLWVKDFSDRSVKLTVRYQKSELFFSGRKSPKVRCFGCRYFGT